MSSYFTPEFDRDEYDLIEYGLKEAANDDDNNNNDNKSNDKEQYSDIDIRMTGSRQYNTTQQPQPPPQMRATGGKHGSTNTGVKGVKQDYKESKQHLINKNIRDNLRHQRTLQQYAGVNVTPTVEQMEAVHENMMKDKQNNNVFDKNNNNNNKKNTHSTDSDSDFSDDDEILSKLRQERIQTIQNQIPVFGTYERVTLSEFSSIIENIESFVYCVAHLYDNSNMQCTRLNLSFEALAERFTHVKFVRIRIADAIAGYNKNGLPTLLIYKGKDMIESAIRVTDALPTEFTDYDVACLLQSKSILKVPTGGHEVKQYEKYEAMRSDRKKFVLSNASRGYDSDD